MVTFFKKHFISIVALCVFIVGLLWVIIGHNQISCNSGDAVIDYDNKQLLSGVTQTDRIIGLVIGVGELYVIVCCWLMERKNKLLRKELDDIRGQLMKKMKCETLHHPTS